MKKYIFKYKLLFSVVTLILVILSGLQIVEVYALKLVMDVVTSKSFNMLTRNLIYCGVVSIAVYATRLLYINMKNKFILKTLVNIKNEAYNGILRRDTIAFKKVDIGSYTSNLTNDIEVIESDYIEQVFQFVEGSILFLFAMVSLIYISPLVAVYVCAISVIQILISNATGKKRMSFMKKVSTANEKITSKSKGILSGFELIKAYNIEDKVQKDFSECNYNCEEAKFETCKFFAKVNGLINMVHILASFSPMIIAAYLSIKGYFTVGTVLQILQLMSYISTPIIIIPLDLNSMKGCKPILDKILELINSESSSIGHYEKNSFDNEIIFDNISFSYDENKEILKEASLTIKKGEKCAIVGNSGCGKSTFVKLLMRFYNNYRGAITIDGVDIKDIKLDNMYNLICPINQKVYMFNDTIKNNIKLYNNYSDEEVDRATRKSGLKSVIEKLSKGLENEVGEDGNSLSGGEKQRISIARAFIKNSPIFVVDEATSSLDNETAYNIETSLIEEKDLTCVVVTHKLNKEILERYDKIVVLNNGTINEVGTFEELMNKKEYFYSLYNVAN